ncbi:MAG TPA: asparagine synthase-related protein [Gemmatimonadota bacterium]|nr:asparagine synthase-related protein [Gemmatimonadota bacterium]
MSGICGVVVGGGSAVEPGVVAAMVGAASHRGPDGTGEWSEGCVALGYLTLDLSAGAGSGAGAVRQPLAAPGGGPVVVADARVDNRDELLAALGADRPAGGAPSDGELLLAAYRRWGTGCAAHVIGDFAFAVWDASHRRLFCARDPMGMRALYYRVEPGRVLFATEVKQILAVPGVPCRIFEPAVAGYLAGAFGRLEWSFYDGVDQLPPAHALVVEAGRHRTWRYWDADPGERIEYAAEDDYAEHFLELFKEAVRSRLRSARPVGISLSGGLDSGSIAATAGWLVHHEPRHGPPALRAYSSAFRDPELAACDERYISDRIAGHWQIPVTAVPADDAWPLVDYPEHGPDRDAPHLFVYQALVERILTAARADGVATLLSGDRGDELVGDWIYDYPGLLRDRGWRVAWAELREQARGSGGRLRRVLRREVLEPLWRASPFAARAPSRSRSGPGWIRPDFAERSGLRELLLGNRDTPPGGHAWRGRYGRIFSFAGMMIAQRREQTAARSGLGYADPWSDRNLAEFVLAIPQHLVNRASERKRLARRAIRPLMPDGAADATRKTIPEGLFDRGFRERARETVLGLISNSRAAALGYVDEAALREAFESYLRNEPQRHDFWSPLRVEIWLRRYWS